MIGCFLADCVFVIFHLIEQISQDFSVSLYVFPKIYRLFFMYITQVKNVSPSNAKVGILLANNLKQSLVLKVFNFNGFNAFVVGQH